MIAQAVIQGGGNLAAVDAWRNGAQELTRIREMLGFDMSSPENRAASLPFSLRDATASAETELQAVVIGRKKAISFPISGSSTTWWPSSTAESPALNGCCDSDARLKKDLAELGVFDAGMPLYLLYRLRRCADMASPTPHIPDTPFAESERRQIFFGAAIGIPTFFIHGRTPNLFMQKILKRTERTRPSRRYKGYIRVYQKEYRRAVMEKRV